MKSWLFELSPELSAELMQLTNGEGEVNLAESSDPSRSMEAILAEAGFAPETSQPATQATDMAPQATQSMSDG